MDSREWTGRWIAQCGNREVNRLRPGTWDNIDSRLYNSSFVYGHGVVYILVVSYLENSTRMKNCPVFLKKFHCKVFVMESQFGVLFRFFDI